MFKRLRKIFNSQSKIQNPTRSVLRQHKSKIPLLLLLLFVWSIILGWGLASAMSVPHTTYISEPASSELIENVLAQNSNVTKNSIGTVDPVSSRYQLGQELYLENCSSCHMALPPEVFPSETWRQLLQDGEHYGTQVPKIIGPTLLLMWDYLRTYSRSPIEKEQLPYRLSESRYFKALHPRVDLPRTIKIDSCVSCHPSAAGFNFRSLSAQWENSP